MPTIKEIRTQYPQYDDLPDGALAAKLHKAYYADMPFGDFADKVQLFDKPKEEGLWEGFVKPTMKAIPKVVGATAGGLAAMPVAGLAGLAKTMTSGIDEGGKTVEEISSIPQQLLDTPEEQAGMENVMLAMKPFQMAGEGWGQIGRAITDGAPNALPIEPILGTVGEAAAMFGLPAGAGKVRGKFKSLDQLREALANRAADMPTVPVTRQPMGPDAPTSKFSPELAAQLQQRKPLALPPGQGFTMPEGTPYLPEASKAIPMGYTEPSYPSRPFSPELATDAQRAGAPSLPPGGPRPAELPAGQGFEMVDPPYQKPIMPGLDVSDMIIKDMIDRAKSGNNYGIEEVNTGGGWERRHIGTDNPNWLYEVLRDTKSNKQEVISVLNKFMDGSELTGKQGKIASKLNQIIEDQKKSSYYSDIQEKLGLYKDGFVDTPEGIVAADIKVGDQFVKGGEKFKVIKEHDDGSLTIKDGDTFKVDFFDRIEADHFKEADPTPIPFKPGAKSTTLYSNPIGAAAEWIANTGPARKLAAFFNPELSVPQGKEWMYSRQGAKGMTALGEKFADSFVNKYKGLKPEERQAIWEQMDSGADISTLPKNLQAPANEFRLQDNYLGKMLVDNGLLSEETYKANMGNHIRYIYNIYQQGGDLMGGMGQKINKGFLKSRKDMTDLDRQRLGLVKDPIQAIATSIADTHRAVGMAQHFKTIADNPNWTFSPATVLVEGKKMGIGKAQKMLDAYSGVERSGQSLNPEQVSYRDTLQTALKDAEAVNVPKDFIQINGSQYGDLDGHYVRKAIAQDIKPILDVFKSSSETANKVVSGIVAANGLWKMKNVALNIPTAARNTISNPSQLLMSGMRPDRVVTRTVEAIADMAKGGKYYDEALKQGLFKTNFTTGELQDIISVARNFDANNWTGFLSQVQKLGGYYGKIDDVFKLAKFIDVMEKGKGAPEAAYQANKWGMDYSLTHPAIKMLRNSPIGAPFISYQYKVAPLIAESLAKRPWIVGGIASLPWMLQKAVTKDMTDDDAKRYIESLPEYVNNKQVFLIPGAYGMNALDVSYMVPWGNWYQVADSVKDAKVSKAFKQMGVASGLLPSVLYGVTTGKDLFTGQDIISDLDKYDPKRTAWAVTKWIWQQAAPPMLTETSVAGKVSEHLQHGQTSKGLKTEGMNVWPRIGGVNIYPVDPMGKQRGDRYEIQNVRKALMRKMFDRNVSPEERKGAMEAYRMAVQKVRKFQDESLKETVNDSGDENEN